MVVCSQLRPHCSLSYSRQNRLYLSKNKSEREELSVLSLVLTEDRGSLADELQHAERKKSSLFTYHMPQAVPVISSPSPAPLLALQKQQCSIL